MLLRDNYTANHIEELRRRTGADPSILERTIFAFGLPVLIKLHRIQYQSMIQ